MFLSEYLPWLLGIIALLGLSATLICISIAKVILKHRFHESEFLDPEEHQLYNRESMITDSGNLRKFSSTIAGSGALNFLANLVFVAIVFICVGIYLLSMLPGISSPTWLGMVLQGFIYGTAAVYYLSWIRTSHED
jgi:hypothetical protein